MTIRPATIADHAALLALWLRSVRASHTFLSEADVQELYPLVRDAALPALELWCLTDGEPFEAIRGSAAIREPELILGFSGLDGNKLEALFIDPDHVRRGGGRRLVEHARQLKGPLTVDVNEQNPDALRFYMSLGFVVSGRSEFDGQGRPFPLLHLSESPSS